MPSSDRIAGRRDYGGVLIVQAGIAGHQVELLVDTGAAYTTLTRRSITRIGLNLETFTGCHQVYTASGTAISVPTGRIPSIQVGTTVVRDAVVALLDLPPGLRIDGLLGVSVLQQFRTTFDFRHATVVLRPEPLR